MQLIIDLAKNHSNDVRSPFGQFSFNGRLFEGYSWTIPFSKLGGNQWWRQTSEVANSIFETVVVRQGLVNRVGGTHSYVYVRVYVCTRGKCSYSPLGTTDGERAQAELAKEVIRFAREWWGWRSISVYNISPSFLLSYGRSFLCPYTPFLSFSFHPYRFIYTTSIVPCTCVYTYTQDKWSPSRWWRRAFYTLSYLSYLAHLITLKAEWYSIVSR